MILLPLVETAFNPELTTPAAAVSVAAAEGVFETDCAGDFG